jgi:hypothetical protein
MLAARAIALEALRRESEGHSQAITAEEQQAGASHWADTGYRLSMLSS